MKEKDYTALLKPVGTKQTAVEWLVEILDLPPNNYLVIEAKEMEKQQKGYSEEEVLEFTQTIIQQYKFGNTNIEQLDLLKETLQLFKNK
jgi:hypothetical protein